MRRLLIWLVVLAAAAFGIWYTQVRPQPARVQVFFVRSADGSLTVAPVERTFAGRGPESMLRAALDALLVGPTAAERAQGLTTEIPPATRARSLTVREGVAYVDLSSAIASGGGSSSMTGRLWQIVYTATQLPQAPQVRLLIDGQERTSLGGEGVLIDRPIGRPATFPRF